MLISPQNIQGASQKIVINEIIKLCFISAIQRPFIRLFLFHSKITYMRRKMSGCTLLKVSLRLRYSMFRKVTYSISKPNILSYKGSHNKIQPVKLWKFSQQCNLWFSDLLSPHKPNTVSNCPQYESQCRIKPAYSCDTANLWPITVKSLG